MAASGRKGNPPRKGIIMHIVSVVTDGHGRVRLAATRAPDLFRRNVAAETGCARLVWCGVAPPQLGARKFVERLQYAWRDAAMERTGSRLMLPSGPYTASSPSIGSGGSPRRQPVSSGSLQFRGAKGSETRLREHRASRWTVTNDKASPGASRKARPVN